MGLSLAFALAQAILPVSVPALPEQDPCVENADERPVTGRPVESRDLAELTDLGRSDPNDQPSPFGVSPDGKSIAFITRRGNPEANSYCQRLLVMPLDAKQAPREIDRGGAFIRDVTVLRNITAVGTGYAKVITPRWSPDGTGIAFLKKTGRTNQVWLADPAGATPARQVTDLPDDVVDFAWDKDGRGLVLAVRPALRHFAEAAAKEALGGYLYDDRFSPELTDQPLPTAPLPFEYVHWNIAGGTSRPAEINETTSLVPPRPPQVPPNARVRAPSSQGYAAWSEPRRPGQPLSPVQLVMANPAGQRTTCSAVMCEWITRLWWSEDGRTLYALQRTGWARSQSGLLAWRAGEAAPRQVLVTDDALIGCAKPGPEIICAREAAARPRRLVALDPDTGRERQIYDPNPAFRQLRLGQVQRLRFRNAHGVESFADLVLPPGHSRGERHPLVVVQYISDGFLRGGTDDEFPIQALAGKGFAVLSFARPDFMPAALAATSELAMRQANREDWADRRSVQSSLEIAIEMAIATGAVDRGRMGISGFSDGTSTVQWALINSDLFKVAALGACCEDMIAYPLAAGPAFEKFGRDMGYRFFEPDAPEFWKPMSLVLNADKIKAPILVQTGDTDYMIGLDVFAAFKLRKKAFELWILPDEPHFKWQPAHRLAMYERAADWFAFWLMRRKDCSAQKTAQYTRWQAMMDAPSPAELSCIDVSSPLP